MSNCLKSLMPEFMGVICGFLAISLVGYLGYLMSIEPLMEVGDYIQLLVLIIIASTLVFSLHVHRQKEKLDESQIYLESSINLINKAYDVLNSQGNGLTSDRISWVTAARLLTRSGFIASKISLPSHKIIFESEHDFQRHKFGNLLKLDGKPLPVEFFFGTDHLAGDIGRSALSTISVSGTQWIPVRILATVYRFKSFPGGYEDPLETSSEFNNNELERLWLFDDKGAYDYILFRKMFIPAGKDIFYSDGEDKPRKVSQEEINTLVPNLSGLDFE